MDLEEIIFPWIKVIRKKMLKSFPVVKEKTLDILLDYVHDELKNLDLEDTYRAEILYETLNYFHFHFIWKVNWNEESYLLLCCVQLLYYITYIALILSSGNVQSPWLNKAVSTLNFFSDNCEIICDVLLLIRNIPSKYLSAYREILRSALIGANIRKPVDAQCFIKIMLLFRRFKSLITVDDTDKRTDIYNLATKVNCPVDTINFLSAVNNDNECCFTERNIFKKFLNKNLKGIFIKNLFEILFRNKYSEKLLNFSANIKRKSKSTTNISVHQSNVNVCCDVKNKLKHRIRKKSAKEEKSKMQVLKKPKKKKKKKKVQSEKELVASGGTVMPALVSFSGEQHIKPKADSHVDNQNCDSLQVQSKEVLNCEKTLSKKLKGKKRAFSTNLTSFADGFVNNLSPSRKNKKRKTSNIASYEDEDSVFKNSNSPIDCNQDSHSSESSQITKLPSKVLISENKEIHYTNATLNEEAKNLSSKNLLLLNEDENDHISEKVMSKSIDSNKKSKFITSSPISGDRPLVSSKLHKHNKISSRCSILQNVHDVNQIQAQNEDFAPVDDEKCISNISESISKNNVDNDVQPNDFFRVDISQNELVDSKICMFAPVDEKCISNISESISRNIVDNDIQPNDFYKVDASQNELVDSKICVLAPVDDEKCISNISESISKNNVDHNVQPNDFFKVDVSQNEFVDSKICMLDNTKEEEECVETKSEIHSDKSLSISTLTESNAVDYLDINTTCFIRKQDNGKCDNDLRICSQENIYNTSTPSPKQKSCSTSASYTHDYEHFASPESLDLNESSVVSEYSKEYLLEKSRSIYTTSDSSVCLSPELQEIINPKEVKRKKSKKQKPSKSNSKRLSVEEMKNNEIRNLNGSSTAGTGEISLEDQIKATDLNSVLFSKLLPSSENVSKSPDNLKVSDENRKVQTLQTDVKVSLKPKVCSLSNGDFADSVKERLRSKSKDIFSTACNESDRLNTPTQKTSKPVTSLKLSLKAESASPLKMHSKDMHNKKTVDLSPNKLPINRQKEMLNEIQDCKEKLINSVYNKNPSKIDNEKQQISRYHFSDSSSSSENELNISVNEAIETLDNSVHDIAETSVILSENFLSKNTNASEVEIESFPKSSLDLSFLTNANLNKCFDSKNEDRRCEILIDQNSTFIKSSTKLRKRESKKINITIEPTSEISSDSCYELNESNHIAEENELNSDSSDELNVADRTASFNSSIQIQSKNVHFPESKVKTTNSLKSCSNSCTNPTNEEEESETLPENKDNCRNKENPLANSSVDKNNNSEKKKFRQQLIFEFLPKSNQIICNNNEKFAPKSPKDSTNLPVVEDSLISPIKTQSDALQIQTGVITSKLPLSFSVKNASQSCNECTSTDILEKLEQSKNSSLTFSRCLTQFPNLNNKEDTNLNKLQNFNTFSDLGSNLKSDENNLNQKVVYNSDQNSDTLPKNVKNVTLKKVYKRKQTKSRRKISPSNKDSCDNQNILKKITQDLCNKNVDPELNCENRDTYPCDFESTKNSHHTLSKNDPISTGEVHLVLQDKIQNDTKVYENECGSSTELCSEHSKSLNSSLVNTMPKSTYETKIENLNNHLSVKNGHLASFNYLSDSNKLSNSNKKEMKIQELNLSQKTNTMSLEVYPCKVNELASNDPDVNISQKSDDTMSSKVYPFKISQLASNDCGGISSVHDLSAKENFTSSVQPLYLSDEIQISFSHENTSTPLKRSNSISNSPEAGKDVLNNVLDEMQISSVFRSKSVDLTQSSEITPKNLAGNTLTKNLVSVFSPKCSEIGDKFSLCLNNCSIIEKSPFKQNQKSLDISDLAKKESPNYLIENNQLDENLVVSEANLNNSNSSSSMSPPIKLSAYQKGGKIMSDSDSNSFDNTSVKKINKDSSSLKHATENKSGNAVSNISSCFKKKSRRLASESENSVNKSHSKNTSDDSKNSLNNVIPKSDSVIITKKHSLKRSKLYMNDWMKYHGSAPESFINFSASEADSDDSDCSSDSELEDFIVSDHVSEVESEQELNDSISSTNSHCSSKSSFAGRQSQRIKKNRKISSESDDDSSGDKKSAINIQQTKLKSKRNKILSESAEYDDSDCSRDSELEDFIVSDHVSEVESEQLNDSISSTNSHCLSKSSFAGRKSQRMRKNRIISSESGEDSSNDKKSAINTQQTKLRSKRNKILSESDSDGFCDHSSSGTATKLRTVRKGKSRNLRKNKASNFKRRASCDNTSSNNIEKNLPQNPEYGNSETNRTSFEIGCNTSNDQNLSNNSNPALTVPKSSPNCLSSKRDSRSSIKHIRNNSSQSNQSVNNVQESASCKLNLNSSHHLPDVVINSKGRKRKYNKSTVSLPPQNPYNLRKRKSHNDLADTPVKVVSTNQRVSSNNPAADSVSKRKNSDDTFKNIHPDPVQNSINNNSNKLQVSPVLKVNCGELADAYPLKNKVLAIRSTKKCSTPKKILSSNKISLNVSDTDSDKTCSLQNASVNVKQTDLGISEKSDALCKDRHISVDGAKALTKPLDSVAFSSQPSKKNKSKTENSNMTIQKRRTINSTVNNKKEQYIRFTNDKQNVSKNMKQIQGNSVQEFSPESITNSLENALPLSITGDKNCGSSTQANKEFSDSFECVSPTQIQKNVLNFINSCDSFECVSPTQFQNNVLKYSTAYDLSECISLIQIQKNAQKNSAFVSSKCTSLIQIQKNAQKNSAFVSSECTSLTQIPRDNQKNCNPSERTSLTHIEKAAFKNSCTSDSPVCASPIQIQNGDQQNSGNSYEYIPPTYIHKNGLEKSNPLTVNNFKNVDNYQKEILSDENSCSLINPSKNIVKGNFSVENLSQSVDEDTQVKLDSIKLDGLFQNGEMSENTLLSHTQKNIHKDFEKCSVKTNHKNVGNLSQLLKHFTNSDKTACNLQKNHPSSYARLFEKHLLLESKKDVTDLTLEKTQKSPDVFSQNEPCNDLLYGNIENSDHFVTSEKDKDNLSQEFLVDSGDERLMCAVVDEFENDSTSLISDNFLKDTSVDNFIECPCEQNLANNVISSDQHIKPSLLCKDNNILPLKTKDLSLNTSASIVSKLNQCSISSLNTSHDSQVLQYVPKANCDVIFSKKCIVNTNCNISDPQVDSLNLDMSSDKICFVNTNYDALPPQIIANLDPCIELIQSDKLINSGKKELQGSNSSSLSLDHELSQMGYEKTGPKINRSQNTIFECNQTKDVKNCSETAVQSHLKQSIALPEQFLILYNPKENYYKVCALPKEIPCNTLNKPAVTHSESQTDINDSGGNINKTNKKVNYSNTEEFIIVNGTKYSKASFDPVVNIGKKCDDIEIKSNNNKNIGTHSSRVCQKSEKFTKQSVRKRKNKLCVCPEC